MYALATKLRRFKGRDRTYLACAVREVYVFRVCVRKLELSNYLYCIDA